MAILAECPQCHKKQAVKNRNCGCGANLVKEKRLKKVRYWVIYRLANGKQRKEFVGKDQDDRPLGIEEARAAEGKRKGQKKENPSILEQVPVRDDNRAFPARRNARRPADPRLPLIWRSLWRRPWLPRLSIMTWWMAARSRLS